MKVLWTDGSASPNPGPGGFAVLEVKDGVVRPVCLGKENKTTNIRMEGRALIAAMKYAAGEECEIHTDSEFWINVLTKWALVWQKAGWKKRTGQIKNLELVQQLYAIYDKDIVQLKWVRGHVGTEYNELADTWANKARQGMTIEEIKL